MKNYLLYITGGLLLLAACARDKGNYDYIDIPDPVVTNLDTAYIAIVGDSLIISPTVELKSGKNDYSCFWQIAVPERAMSLDYEGRELRIVFGLAANRYNVLLRVQDNNTGQRYFFEFVIKGQTEFTRGTLVLSNDGAHSKLSFVKPDDSVQPDIYSAINEEALPGGAMQLVPIRHQFYMNQLNYYWLTYSGNGSGAVQLDANTLQRSKYLKENFYDPPATIEVGSMLNMLDGVTTGIFNGKLYRGTTETAPFWPYYGFWGVPIEGNYNLHPRVLYNSFENPYDTYFLGFEKNKKQFIRFLGNTYFDTSGYNVPVPDTAFNPKDLKMDLIHMDRFGDDNLYAYCDSMGKKIELRFAVRLNAGERIFRALAKREFAGASLLTPDTKWASSPIQVFFFSSGDKIYRYNPLSEEIKVLDANFNGKDVTMLKVLNNGDLLMAGTEGSLYYLNISTGNNGVITKQIDGFPGEVVDILARDN